MPAWRCCSKSAISLWDRHPRRLVQKKSQSIVNWPTLCNKRSFWAFNCFNSRLSSWGVSNTLPACYSNASRHPIGAAPDCYPDKSGQHLHQKQARTPAYPDIAKEFNDSFSWRAAIATFALNEASNLRCLPIILKILLAKVLLFFAFARLSDFSGGLYNAW